MLPTQHSDIITSIKNSIKNEKHIQNLLTIANNFKHKQKITQAYYDLIVMDKKISNENDCDTIIALTPYMDEKTYTFFKKHNAISTTKPDFKFVNKMINITNEEYLVEEISKKSSKTLSIIKSYTKLTVANIPVALSSLILEIFYGSGDQVPNWIDVLNIISFVALFGNLCTLLVICVELDLNAWKLFKFSQKKRHQHAQKGQVSALFNENKMIMKNLPQNSL